MTTPFSRAPALKELGFPTLTLDLLFSLTTTIPLFDVLRLSQCPAWRWIRRGPPPRRKLHHRPRQDPQRARKGTSALRRGPRKDVVPQSQR